MNGWSPLCLLINKNQRSKISWAFPFFYSREWWSTVSRLSGCAPLCQLLPSCDRHCGCRRRRNRPPTERSKEGWHSQRNRRSWFRIFQGGPGSSWAWAPVKLGKSRIHFSVDGLISNVHDLFVYCVNVVCQHSWSGINFFPESDDPGTWYCTGYSQILIRNNERSAKNVLLFDVLKYCK